MATPCRNGVRFQSFWMVCSAPEMTTVSNPKRNPARAEVSDQKKMRLELEAARESAEGGTAAAGGGSADMRTVDAKRCDLPNYFKTAKARTKLARLVNLCGGRGVGRLLRAGVSDAGLEAELALVQVGAAFQDHAEGAAGS